MKSIASMLVLVSSVALAQDSAVTLNCPTGTRQFNDGEGLFCSHGKAPGAEKLDGPYVGLNKNGTVQSRGQYTAGARTGHWVFFDAQGVKTHEVDFVNDHFHGQRIEFHANGQRTVETYVAGTLVGSPVRLDVNGAVLKTQP